jgi:hypothetical protein
MKTCSKELQDELLLAFTNEDKTLLQEFIDIYSPYEELKKEYHHIDPMLFESYYQESIKAYMG